MGGSTSNARAEVGAAVRRRRLSQGESACVSEPAETSTPDEGLVSGADGEWFSRVSNAGGAHQEQAAGIGLIDHVSAPFFARVPHRERANSFSRFRALRKTRH